MTPTFAEATAASRPIHVVSADTLDAFRQTLPDATRLWLETTGFEAALGDVRLIPAEDGSVGEAVLGFGTAKTRRRTRFGTAKGIAGLPAGNWHLEGTLGLAEKTEIALGALLAQYRFDDYRPSAKPATPPLLKCPEGCDGALLLAMAEGEFLTRDLINTPASDLGPAELEAAFFDLADRFVADAKAITGDALLAQNFPMIHAVGRASLVAFFIMTDVTGLVFLSREGLVTTGSAIMALAFLPALAAGVWLGARSFTSADPAVFRRYVLIILAGLALLTAVKALLGF